MITIITPPGSSISPDVVFSNIIPASDTVTGAVTFYDGEFFTAAPLPNYYETADQSPIGFESVAFTSLTPDVCAIGTGNRIEYVADGVGRVKVSNGRASKIHQLPFEDGDTDARIADGFVVGSYPYFAWEIIKPKLDASTDTAIFTGTSYNSACWAASYDFSGVPVGGLPNGVLFTPQHLWGPWHVQRSVGDVVTFRSKSSPGTTITRTIIGMCRNWVDGAASAPNLSPDPVSANPAIEDVLIYVLDSPVPSSIQHYPLVGDWFFTLINEGSGLPFFSWQGGPVIALDQNRLAHCAVHCAPSLPGSVYMTGSQNLYGTTIPSFPRRLLITPYFPQNGAFEPYAGFVHEGIPGDSGSPCFVPLSGSSLALMTIYTFSTSGDWLPEQVANLMIISANDHAVSLGHTRPTDYQVTVAPDPTL